MLHTHAHIHVQIIAVIGPWSFKGSLATSNSDKLIWWRHKMETFSALLAPCAGNSPVNSPHKGQWRGALMSSLICTWINAWVSNREVGYWIRHHAHYDVIVMLLPQNTRIATSHVIENDTKIEVIVVSPTTWEAHHSPGRSPRPVVSFPSRW